jgi:hypothetical protein
MRHQFVARLPTRTRRTLTITTPRESPLPLRLFQSLFNHDFLRGKAFLSYMFPADLRYGVIAVMGESASEPVRCLLVDPPADGNGEGARRLRLLQRMRYLRDWISFISPRSQLASALQTRLAALEQLSNPFLLDGVPLLKGNGNRYDFTASITGFGGHSSLFASKSKISDGPAGGIITPLPNGDLRDLGPTWGLTRLTRTVLLWMSRTQHNRVKMCLL